MGLYSAVFNRNHTLSLRFLTHAIWLTCSADDKGERGEKEEEK